MSDMSASFEDKTSLIDKSSKLDLGKESEITPWAPCKRSPRRSQRLSKRAQRQLKIPSNKEELEKIVPSGTPHKGYDAYRPRKRVNNLIKENSYYNSDKLSFEELDANSSDGSFVSTSLSDDSSSTTTTTTTDSNESERCSRLNTKRKKKNLHRCRILRYDSDSNSETEEYLLTKTEVPAKKKKTRLSSSCSGSESSSDEEKICQAPKIRLTNHSILDSDNDSDGNQISDSGEPINVGDHLPAVLNSGSDDIQAPNNSSQNSDKKSDVDSVVKIVDDSSSSSTCSDSDRETKILARASKLAKKKRVSLEKIQQYQKARSEKKNKKSPVFNSQIYSQQFISYNQPTT